MIGFDYKVTGYQRVANNFRKLVSVQRSYFRHTLSQFGEETTNELTRTPYPAPRGSYIRTYELQRGFRSQVVDDTTVRFWNVAQNLKGFRYPNVVIQRGNQAWFHLYRWWTLEDIVENRMDRLRQLLYRKIERDWSR